MTKKDRLIHSDAKLFAAKLDWLRGRITEYDGAALGDQALAAAYLDLSRHFEDKRQRERTARLAQHWEELRQRRHLHNKEKTA
jgi:hypothetical protein